MSTGDGPANRAVRLFVAEGRAASGAAVAAARPSRRAGTDPVFAKGGWVPGRRSFRGR